MDPKSKQRLVLPEVTDGTTALQRGSSVLLYGSCHDRWLTPILVEHDRSRHAERRSLVALMAEVAKLNELKG